ncbi:MAG: hypothetical protein U5K71_08725 [Gracilimonas sp.]|nr:hypothetical protein [Gracilimonas sp.]
MVLLKFLQSTYKGILGTAEKPGVFFVEGDTKFTSNTEGFGIMVVRNYGTVSGDSTLLDETTGSLDLKGGFTFNGLIIFENAYNMDGKGNGKHQRIGFSW